MKIARTGSTLGIVRSRSRSWCDFEIFLHLPQYKLSSISALAHIRMLLLSICVLLECLNTIYKYGHAWVI